MKKECPEMAAAAKDSELIVFGNNVIKGVKPSVQMEAAKGQRPEVGFKFERKQI